MKPELFTELKHLSEMYQHSFSEIEVIEKTEINGNTVRIVRVDIHMVVDGNERIKVDSTTYEGLIDFLEQKVKCLPRCFLFTDRLYREIAIHQQTWDGSPKGQLFEKDIDHVHLLIEGAGSQTEAYATDQDGDEMMTDFDINRLYEIRLQTSQSCEQASQISQHTYDILNRQF